MSFIDSSYIAIDYPSGSILSYLGISDPMGWIICNGVIRTNNSDRRYNNLAALGIGTGGSGTSNYTPPDLKGNFLSGSTTLSLNTISGSSAITLTNANLPTHTHAGTTGGSNTSLNHNHTDNRLSAVGGATTIGFAAGTGTITAGYNTPNVYNSSTPAPPSPVTNTPVYPTSSNITDLSHTHIFTTAATGQGQSFSIMPPYYTVNWIIKL